LVQQADQLKLAGFARQRVMGGAVRHELGENDQGEKQQCHELREAVFKRFFPGGAVVIKKTG
jgi:hypothetical protein